MLPQPPPPKRTGIQTNKEIPVSSGYLLHFSVNGEAQEMFDLLQSNRDQRYVSLSQK